MPCIHIYSMTRALCYRIWNDQCDIDRLESILRKQGGWVRGLRAGCYSVYIPETVVAWYLLAYPDLYRKSSDDYVI
jgi:hypothetical protein